MEFTLDIGKDFDNGGFGLSAFWQHVAKRQLAHVTNASWPIEQTNLEKLDDVVFREQWQWGETVVVERLDYLAAVALDAGELQVRVAADTSEKAASGVTYLRKRFPRSEPSENEVPVSFWTYGRHGPTEYNRRLVTQSWETIAANYPARSRTQLEQMMRSFVPALGGQLLLWQGEPGTGKTWALRALAWEWRSWARFHYIVDPDKMLGDHADYLTTLLLRADDEPQPTFAIEAKDDDAKPDETWRVIVLEDSGELLAADAKERTGQALSRLLNVVDGLIGQGLRILVLVTTNEELKRLHPAVARPGRCAAQITFERFDRDDALDWLLAVNLDVPTSMSTPSLAELYAIRDDYVIEPATGVGFTR